MHAMRTHASRTLILAAVALGTSALPGPAEADRFCGKFNRIYGPVSAPATQSVDALERSDGIDIDCERQVIDFKKAISAPFNEVRGDWFDRKRSHWNLIYCRNDDTREAIQSGWEIVSTFTFADGQTRTLRATC